MRLMAWRDEPDDFVIATGEAHTVEEFVAAAFGELGLDWREHVRYDQEFARGRSESKALVGDPTKAREELGWERDVGFAELVRMMVQTDLELLKDQAASPR
jgi:GDPmannose 4,6-dehydratase